MKRAALIAILFVAGLLTLSGQSPDRIKSNPDIIWAVGSGENADNQALEALTERIARLISFGGKPRSLILSYQDDIRKNSHKRKDGQHILRYLSKQELNGIFAARRQKAKEMISQGDATGTRLYYEWAWYYLSSLPDSSPEELRNLEKKLRLLHPGPEEMDVKSKLSYIQREVEQIRLALNAAPKKIPVPKETAASVLPPKPTLYLPAVSAGLPGISLLQPPASLAPATVCPAPERPAPVKGSFYVLVEYGLMPENGFGACLAAKWGRWGGYVSFLSNYVSDRYDYTCLQNGRAGDRYIWPNGHTRVPAFKATTGLMLGIAPWLNVTAGGGWGRRMILWEDTDAAWAHVDDLSVKGVCLEAGLLAQWKPVCLRVGIHTIGWRTFGFTVGGGIYF